MSFVYWLSKFSREAIALQLFFIALLLSLFFAHLLFKRRKYGVASKQIPDQVVRAFLIDILSQVESFKGQLFGSDFKPGLNLKTEPLMNSMLGLSTVGSMPTASANDSAELAALKAQLTQALSKQTELAQQLTHLNAEKGSLQTQLSQAKAAGAGGGGGGLSAGDQKALAEAQDKIKKLQSMLAEYEVIEDDLANLKRYQQENKQLKAELEASRGGKPAPAPAPEPVATPVAAAEAETVAAEPAPAEPNPLLTETPLSDTGASPLDANLVADAQTSPQVSDDSLAVAQTATPEAAAPAESADSGSPAAPSAPASSDADLLQEFEKMLNS